MAYVCQHCGDTHDGLPLDIGFEKPGAYFLIPEAQRTARCRLTSDSCIIDGERFFIRGCLFVPIHDLEEHFVWGFWAEVSPHVFSRHQALFACDGSREPRHRAVLSVEREKRYTGMDGLLVSVQFTTAEDRPRFVLQPSNHWLCRDQESGITLHRVQEILHRLFPEQF